jgi:hypothetical protein
LAQNQTQHRLSADDLTQLARSHFAWAATMLGTSIVYRTVPDQTWICLAALVLACSLGFLIDRWALGGDRQDRKAAFRVFHDTGAIGAGFIGLIGVNLAYLLIILPVGLGAKPNWPGEATMLGMTGALVAKGLFALWLKHKPPPVQAG